MTIEELKINVNKTIKIINYGIKTNLGRDYDVEVYQLDWDWQVVGGHAILSGVMFIIEITVENYGNMEVSEINSFLTEQEQAIYQVLNNQKSTIAEDGLFNPRTDTYQIIGPNVDQIDFNHDFFKTRWIVEVAP